MVCGFDSHPCLQSRRYLSDFKNRWSQVESLAMNSGVGTSVVHGMSVLVRVQTPEPIRGGAIWSMPFN